jgi:photosystem II stability/assembly factor-like uncharacterized protein
MHRRPFGRSVWRALGLVCLVLWMSSLATPAWPTASAGAAASDQWQPTAPIPPGVAAIAVDPKNANIAYAASVNSRIYKTADGGANWTEIMLPIGSYYAITVHPTNTNLLYAGGNTGIVKSINGGISWFERAYLGGFVRVLSVDPTNTMTVYTGSERGGGVYKSINGGVTWTWSLSNTSVTALAVDPLRPNIVYVGAETYDAPPGGVFKSLNAGASWSRVMTSAKVTSLAIDPSNTQLVYAGTEDSGVMKSSDGGVAWAAVNTNLTYPVVSALAIHPLRPNVIYAGTMGGGIFRSVDGGANWSALNAGLPTGANITGLAISTDRGVVYALTSDSKIFKWTGPPPPGVGMTYARVLDQNGRPIGGARVYHNGALVADGRGQPRLTDEAGNLILSGVRAGDTLVALFPQRLQPSARAGHGGWAYQMHLTSLPIGGDGSLQPFKVTAIPGPQTLTVRPTTPLVLFNLVVSIEWDADDAYLGQVARAVHAASDFLLDMTDGQMAFGQVAIYERAELWAGADIQIAASNVVRPHAHVGGITSTDLSHAIRVGRFWNGRSGAQGAWEAPEGYRTLAHEFGHYALYLYDEYFAFVRDASGNIVGERPASCTGPQNRNPATEATNASVMDHQYSSTQLAMRDVPGLWSSMCQLTAQWQINGESDWETLVRKYTDTQVPPRWRFTTPADRGRSLAGPASLPARVLDMPQVAIRRSGGTPPRRLLTVLRPGGAPQRDAIVALYKSGGRVISQGLTDTRGEIEIYGAEPGDSIRAASFDGGLNGDANVGQESSLRIDLKPLQAVAARSGAAQANTIPHLRVIAEPGASVDETSLLVAVVGLGPNATTAAVVTAPGGAAGFAPTLSYDAAKDAYQGQVSFSTTERGTGRLQAIAGVGGSLIRLQSTYRLQRVPHDQDREIFSDDGNLGLHLDVGALPGELAYMVVMSPGALPGPLPHGLLLVGDAYDVTLSGGLNSLQKPARLMLRYDRALINRTTAPDGLAIYRWDSHNHTWNAVAGTLDAEHRALVASVQALGTYALLAPTGAWTQPEPRRTFLPLISR